MAKPIHSQKDLMDLALFYCSKRETSRARMKQYLTRKCREQKLEHPDWIEAVLDECERYKVIDDGRYAGILVREYARRGKGKRYIGQKLKEKGVREDAREFESTDADELERACEVARKSVKKLLPRIERQRERKKSNPAYRLKRTPDLNFELKQKLMAQLVRCGFSMEISKKAAEQALVETVAD